MFDLDKPFDYNEAMANPMTETKLLPWLRGEMRTIAIVLGDNDFGNTFRPLLEGLKPILSENQLVESNVELIIRKSIIAYYVGYQHRFDMHKDSEADLEHIGKYLSGIKVLFDDVAEEDIATVDHDGGAWYLELQSGIVSGY